MGKTSKDNRYQEQDTSMKISDELFNEEGISPDDLIDLMLLDEESLDEIGWGRENIPSSHHEADAYLGGKSERRGLRGKNTTLFRGENGDIHYRLHRTNIATFHPDNSVTLNSGGWRTSTTKAHLNDVLGSRGRITQTKGEWHFQGQSAQVPGHRGYEHPFRDGLRVHAAGHVLNPER